MNLIDIGFEANIEGNYWIKLLHRATNIVIR